MLMDSFFFFFTFKTYIYYAFTCTFLSPATQSFHLPLASSPSLDKKLSLSVSSPYLFSRAEVANVSEAVRQGADALMLSGESTMGQFSEKAPTVLRSVSLRIERWWREEKLPMVLPNVASSFSDKISKEICNLAAKMVAGKSEASTFMMCSSPWSQASSTGSFASPCFPWHEQSFGRGDVKPVVLESFVRQQHFENLCYLS